MPRLDDTNLIALLVGLAIAGVLVWMALRIRRWWRSRRAKRRAARAQRGERAAAKLLRRHGYRVVRSQARLRVSPRVDGRPHTHELRADYLVRQWGKRYVAEVKTGAQAPSLSHAPTRRQLLEYSVAFDVHGVLLVDVEAGRIHRVEFPRGRRHQSALVLLTAAAGVLLWMHAPARELLLGFVRGWGVGP